MPDPTTPTWRLVPVEPTADMLDAAGTACEGRFYPADMYHGPRAMDADRYRAMLAAAPAPQELPPVQLPEPVAEIVLFGRDYKEVSWKGGKLPAIGAKLITVEQAEAYALAAIAADRRARGTA